MQELFISQNGNSRIIALVENGKMQEYYEEKENKNHLEGNIYLAKVKDVLPGMQAAFVDIGEEKNTFIHIKDIVPKASNITGNKNEILENYNIRDYIKEGDSILVQVKKDATSNKGARITKNIHIVGRFSILVIGNEFVTISQKIEEQEEKERLISIAKKSLKEYKTKNLGAIIRTSAKNKDEFLIKEDIKNVISKWENLLNKSKNIKDEEIPKVLYKNESIIQKILLDLIDNKLERIVVDDETLYKKIYTFLNDTIGSSKVKLQLKNEDILKTYDLYQQIGKLQNRKIWLKCGGFITIDKTEALTAIDVNSGKYTGKGNLEQTVLKVNKEASKEIAKQLRLRDIGGIIIIDYIDMDEEESRNVIIQELQNCLKSDRAKTQIMEFTKLNLLELTRKHMFS